MQIFLLMILSAFMGGYYYLGSPALNVAHDFLPESVRTKGLIMCVVNEHKRALDDNAKNIRENAYQFEQTSPCAKSKDIITKKFCMTGETISAGCYEKSSESETANYLSDHYFTTRVDLPKNINQNKILDFIKNMSGGLPNLGILFKTENGEFVILNPQTTTDAISIKQILIGANSLRKGQIIYFSHHSPAEVEAIVQNTEFEALECKNKTDIKVFNAEEQIWECRAFESLKKCFGDMLENENGDCIPNPDEKINCSSDMRAKFNYDASAWECQRRLSITCGEGETLSWNGTINQYVCVSDAEWDGGECEELIPNSDGSYSTVRIGGTASGYPCGPCEKALTGKCTDECFPDPASVPENLCAGGDCGYTVDNDFGWIENCNDSETGNCAKHKAIYWHNDTNRWKCVDCFPLDIKSNYKSCLNGNIWRINSSGEKELDTPTACVQDGNYEDKPTSGDIDGCYLEDEGLYCSFSGIGGYLDEDENINPYGEKGFFCNISGIDDTLICGTDDGSSWAWYNYNTSNCYDPYDGNEVLQALPNTNSTAAPSTYSGLSFGCPTGYYRFRENSGQISECKKSFCIQDDSVSGQNDFPSYAARIETTRNECKTGYVEVLNDTQECFYCWIPPFEHPTYDLKEESSLNGVSYLKAQAGSKSSTIAEGADTFEYRLANEIGADCDTDVDNYCKDTALAHQSPPGWKRAWSNGTWSDAEPFWCADNHYPTDVNGDVDVNYLPANTTNMRCPAKYQTKLNGKNNETTEVLSACLYCLPEPFDINEVEAVYGVLPAHDDTPYITAPQQPGAWKIKNCNGIDAENRKENQEPYNALSSYVGSNYAYNNGQCALSSNTTGCENGLERIWGTNGWGDCSPIYCDEVVASGYVINSDKDKKTGAYIPVQKSYDDNGETKHCIYMWRPPYDIATWSDWKTKSSYFVLNGNNWAEDVAVFFISSPECNTNDYCSDQSSPYTLDGSIYTWTSDDIGWTVATNWCDGISTTIPTNIFPYTGKLNSDDPACFNKAQPTLDIWRAAKPQGGCLAGACDTDEFNQAIHDGCKNSSCSTNVSPPTPANMQDIPFKSNWEANGWSPLEVDYCGETPPSSSSPEFVGMYKNTNGTWCLDTYIPEYSFWKGITGDKPTYSKFVGDGFPTDFAFKDCGTSKCSNASSPQYPGGMQQTWDGTSLGWVSTINWCKNYGYGTNGDVRDAVLFPFTAKFISTPLNSTNPCFKKVMPSLKIWRSFTGTFGDNQSFKNYMYDECEDNPTTCRGSITSPFAEENIPFESSWNNTDGWEDSVPKYCNPTPSVAPVSQFVGKAGSGDYNYCINIYVPNSTDWDSAVDDENTNGVLKPTYQQFVDEGFPTDFAFKDCTSSASCPSSATTEHELSTPFKRDWVEATGWTALEVDYCGGTTPSSSSPEFVSKVGATGTWCLDTYIPEYSVWNTLDADNDLTNGIQKPTYQQFVDEGFPTDFAFCQNCTSTTTLTSNCSGLSFVNKTWDDTTSTFLGWDSICEVTWNTDYSSPTEPDKRFLVPSDTSANEGILWIPDYPTWNSAYTWDYFNADRENFTTPYTCPTGGCGANTTSPPWVPDSSTPDTSCYQYISYRNWTNAGGWGACLLNMCSGTEDSNMLLKKTSDTAPSPFCGTNTIPAPHRTFEPALKTECNGTDIDDDSCFYEVGYGDPYDPAEYSYEELTRAKCPDSGEDWDEITNWSNNSWDANCSDRLCGKGDLPISSDAPYSTFAHLWDYYPPTVSTSSCAAGLVATGKSYGSDVPVRNCKYCGVDTVTGMTCPSTMHTFYTNTAGKVDCAFPAPPTSTCTADDPRWGVPPGKAEETYWFGCDDLSIEYIIPATNFDSYDCSSGIYNCSLATTTGSVNCGGEIINCGIAISDAQSFLDILSNDKVVCGSGGTVKGWKIKTYTP